MESQETVVDQTQETQEAQETQEVHVEADQSAEAEAAPVADDAAFEAGFKAAQGIEPEPETEPEPPAKELIAGMTEDEVKALLQKAAEVDKLREAQSKVFGTLGALRQTIDALRNQPAPTAAALQLTKDKLKRLGESFPELAEMLAEDLSGALTVQSIDPSAFERVVESKLHERLNAQQQVFETKLLSAMHPDWRHVASSPEFAQWKSGLDPETTAQLDSSWDAVFIGSKLTEFKNWKAQQAKSQLSKTKRLEAAVAPKGAAKPPVLTDEDAFIAGFKSARGVS